MAFHWRKFVSILSVSSAVSMLVACSGPVDDPELNAGASDEEEYAEDDGVVLGMSWEALSYPYCTSFFADPDGDGFGFEYGHACVVYRAWTPTFPTCMSAYSDPDGDGYGWENNRTCVVNNTSGTSGGTSSGSSGTSTTSGGQVCQNLEGTASTMAALAVSAAMEMGRWQPRRDFAIGNVDGTEGLILSAEGKSRCSDHVCANTQALLDFQRNAANGMVKFPGGVSLNSAALRSRLVAKYKDQVSCEMQPSNGGTTNCPVEDHTLTFQRSEKGGCDTNYYFVARKPDGSPLQFPAQLKNKLLWADPVNPYIGFQSVGEVVSIDPTYGLNERGSTTSGACYAACVKVGLEDVSGDCCTCGGRNRAFKRAPWNASTYLCQ
jgi:hypothetical protein